MKYGWAMTMFGLRTAAFATQNHELHRIRRAAIAHYFSRGSLLRLEPGVQSVADKLASRLEDVKHSGGPVNLFNVYACFTADVVGQYAFAHTYNLLEDPDFSPWWHELLMDVSKNSHTLKQFPWMLPMMQSMPHWLVRRVDPGMMALIDFQAVCFFLPTSFIDTHLS